MSEERPATGAACSQCGAKVLSAAPEGLCPRCLVGMGLSLINTQTGDRTEGKPEQAPPLPGEPRRFGDYELLDEIARGGMGIVYRARQISLNRIVAVKVLLFGRFASDAFVKRFRAEAEAAASLRHPNIVAIHDIGGHDGQHYFSMDFIEGQSLADLTRGGPLPARRAASHLEKIALAIHYAHQQGVIHRDLKPSNVLIDATGEPHITDFGLAKRLADDGELTTTGQVLGSPNFMPPEQADPSLGSVWPSGDIYSLGALFYHLLTGRPPFVGESIEATLRQLLHQDPVAPRLLDASIPVDLETICLKCLERNPSRRFPTALALAEDLGRFLRNEPIRIRPLGRVQRLWRWCGREPVLAGLTFSLGAVLVVGLITASSLLWREQVARERASVEADKSRQLAVFLQQMLSRAGPSASLGRDTTLLREILDQTAQRIDRELTNQPTVVAELRDTIGRTYRDIGDLQKAIVMHRESWRLRRELGDDKSPSGAMTLSLLAQALTEHEDLDEAEKLIREAMSLWKSLRGAADEKYARALTCLGSIYSRRGDLPQAKVCYEQALAIHRGDNDPAAYSPLNNLANVLTKQKDFAGAEKAYREALVLIRQKYGDQHPETALLLRNLGDVLNAQGKLDEASATHSQALATRAGLLDEVHPLLADSFERLGVVTLRQVKWADAENLFRKAIAIRRKLSPDDPREWDEDANSLAEALNGQLKFEESERALTELISASKDGDPRVARLYFIRGKTRGRSGNWSEAAKDFRLAEHLEPTNHWYAYLLAPLLLETKEAAAYQALCSRSLVQFAGADADTAAQVALMNLLSADRTNDLAPVHAIIDHAMDTAARHGTNAYYVAIKALAELRSHEPARAVERLQNLLEDLAANRLQGGRYLRVQAQTVLALAHHALGHAPEARQALTLARTIAPAKIQIPPNGDYGVWHEWLFLQLHLREAASLIEGATGQVPSAGDR